MTTERSSQTPGLGEHEIVKSLQAHLLPSSLPTIPGVHLSARYLPAGSPTGQMGGDWYDSFILPDGKLAIAIGDVAGHGATASVAMSQLRNCLRAYALDGGEPAQLITRLSRFARTTETGACATLLFGLFDPDTTLLTLTSAGHLPPLLVGSSGGSEFVDLPASVPLGAVRLPAYQQIQLEFATGSTLLFFTDGLVKKPGESLNAGLERLQDRFEPIDDPLDLCDRLISAMLPTGSDHDDVAVITLHTEKLSNPLLLTLAAEPETAPHLRKVIGRWLSQYQHSPRATAEIKIACGEASANAIEHAYSPFQATFDFEIGQSETELVIRVSDHGSWREPRGKHRGRGIQLMEALMSHVEIARTDLGSIVTLRRQLTEEVQR